MHLNHVIFILTKKTFGSDAFTYYTQWLPGQQTVQQVQDSALPPLQSAQKSIALVSASAQTSSGTAPLKLFFSRPIPATGGREGSKEYETTRVSQTVDMVRSSGFCIRSFVTYLNAWVLLAAAEWCLSICCQTKIVVAILATDPCMWELIRQAHSNLGTMPLWSKREERKVWVIGDVEPSQSCHRMTLR